MYICSKDGLTTELLQSMLQYFNEHDLPRLKKYKNYYDGLQAIKGKMYSNPDKPCNRAVTNFCKQITDNYNGYIASPDFISYSSESDITDIMEVLRYNDVSQADSDLLQSALIFGRSAELMYIDNEAKTRFKLISPLNCFGIFENNLSNDLLYFVRFYQNETYTFNNSIWNVDVYSEHDIVHYTMSEFGSQLIFVGIENHYFNQCPANIMMMTDERSVYDCVIDLQDSYNELLSAEIDQYAEFVDSHLVITGINDPEDLRSIAKKRIIVLPEGASVEWLTKQNNDTQVENMLKRIQTSIYKTASCPDFSDETFVSGVSSGIAIQFKTSGMEHRAATIASQLKKALQRRIEIICGIASLSIGEDVFRDIKIDMKRNIPEDMNANINLINTLKGLVSDATLLSQLPFVTDVQAELEAVKEQKKENIESYGFAVNSFDENEVDDEA